MMSDKAAPGNPKPVGWLTKLVWWRYQPATVYKVNSKLSVFRCRSQNAPILLAIGGAESHITGLQPETAKRIVGFFDPENAKIELLPGDRIRIWQENGEFKMMRRGLGMPHLTMKDNDWSLLADVLSHILEAGNND